MLQYFANNNSNNNNLTITDDGMSVQHFWNPNNGANDSRLKLLGSILFKTNKIKTASTLNFKVNLWNRADLKNKTTYYSYLL